MAGTFGILVFSWKYIQLVSSKEQDKQLVHKLAKDTAAHVLGNAGQVAIIRLLLVLKMRKKHMMRVNLASAGKDDGCCCMI